MTAPMTLDSRAERSIPTPVAALLDAQEATRRLCDAGLGITAAQPEYLRHKVGETSIISYLFDTPSGEIGRGYVQWCERPERADEIHRKALALRPRMSSVGVSTILVDANTVFYGFPNDARLRRLRWYSTPRKLKRSLAPLAPTGETISKTESTSTLLKYKPERRLVSKVELVTAEGSRERLLVRYATGRNAHRLALTADSLVSNGVQTPAPLAQLDDGRVSVDAFIDGVELRTWLLTRDWVAEELATSLLAFHRTPAPRGTPRRTEADDLANAVGGLRALARWDAGLGQAARSIGNRLTAARPWGRSAEVMIHGDLHDKNVMVDGRDVWFIDLERVAVGSPASDLGRLRAHAISLDIRQPNFSTSALPHAEEVIARYRSASLRPSEAVICDATLAWHCAIALVDQALLVTRHVEPDHVATAGVLLDAARSQLDGASRARVAPTRVVR